LDCTGYLFWAERRHELHEDTLDETDEHNDEHSVATDETETASDRHVATSSSSSLSLKMAKTKARLEKQLHALVLARQAEKAAIRDLARQMLEEEKASLRLKQPQQGTLSLRSIVASDVNAKKTKVLYIVPSWTTHPLCAISHDDNSCMKPMHL
jgi:hypothetical protein